VKVLKIGGSVLTEKHTEEKKVRMEVLDRIASEIAPRADGLILVHGAGSFGHPEAIRHGVGRRFSTEGVLKTHQSVCLLNRIVVSALVRGGVSAVPVSPMGCAIADGGRLVSMEMTPILHMVERGLVPVLHGDVVMDRTLGAAVVSGDALVAHIAKGLGAHHVGMGTSVQGVLDAHGRTIPEITEQNIEQLRQWVRPSGGGDATGGMAGKVEELWRLAGEGIESWVFSALDEGAVAAFLDGHPVGTRVRNVEL